MNKFLFGKRFPMSPALQMFKKIGTQMILPQINYSEFTEDFEVNSTKQ